LAAALEAEHRAFSLAVPAAIDTGLRGVSVVLNCAGPYVQTALPLAEACLRAGAHYLDLTGETSVLQSLADLDAAARARGVMLLPAAGFAVVATDCLAVHLKERLPSATHLALAFHSQGNASASRGTVLSGLGLLARGGRQRRDGRLVPAAEFSKSRTVDFGAGPVRVVSFTWADVFTAYYSTGIKDVEVYVVVPREFRHLVPLFGIVRRLLRFRLVQAAARRVILALPAGPSAEARARTRTHVWGEVMDAAGNRAAARLHGPQAGHDWTARCALAIAERALAGQAPPGFQTPGRAYGPDLILGPAVTREDL
jgi:short subunit dehydrogenase-like uncharacterized protein